MDKRYIAIDTETWLITPGNLAPKLVCVSYYDGTNGDVLDAEMGTAYVYDWLTSEDVVLVGHNIAFDFAVLVRQYPEFMPLVWKAYDEGRVYDTQVYEKVQKIALGWFRIDPTTKRVPNFTLGSLAEEYLGESIEGKHGEDAWRLRYRELDGVPIDEWPRAAYEYARLDAEYTWRVLVKQQTEWPRRAKDRGLPEELPNTEDQFRYAWSMHLMSAWGIRTDGEMVDALEASLGETVTKAMRVLRKKGIYRDKGTKNLSVVRDLVEKAYTKRGAPVPTTPKGAVSTSAQTLQESGHEDLELLASISGDQKLLNTFIPILRSGTEMPINPRFNPLVASGRSSCRKPNLQNQPRQEGVRDCYIPREGKVFAACDYHVAELCSLAQILLNKYKYSHMAEAIQQGRELHLETAAGILDKPYEEVLERHKKGDKEVKQARQLAKAANFGFPGGLGAENFCKFAKASYGLELNEDDAKRLKRQWLDRYPEMQRYFQDIANSCSREGGSFTFVQPGSGRLRGGVGFCDGCNSGFQGLTADGAKLALHEVIRECYLDNGTALFGCRPVAFIHDEVIIEAPEATARVAASRLAQVMVEQMQKYLPDIPVKADAHLMRRWYKAAEPCFDADGNLIPWEPTDGK
jgi:DNA polymerase I-like protein with 3'-5' exonuclease and polymerase domains